MPFLGGKNRFFKQAEAKTRKQQKQKKQKNKKTKQKQIK